MARLTVEQLAKRAAELRAAAGIAGDLHVVGPPWIDSRLPSYVVAGSQDPHGREVVLDSADILEWSDEDPYEAQLARANAALELACLAVNELPRLLEAVRREREIVVAFLRNRAGDRQDEVGHTLRDVALEIAQGEHVADADYGSLSDLLPETVRREERDRIYTELDRLCTRWSGRDGEGDTYAGLSIARELVEDGGQ